MNLDKMKRLEAHGWKVENAEEFLNISEEEKVVMCHAERQKYLKTSGLGELFGVAHLLPDVETDIKD